MCHRLMEERGDVSPSRTFPWTVRRRFPTAYQIPPEAYIEDGCPRAKVGEHGDLPNLYLQRRDLQAMEEVYLIWHGAGPESHLLLVLSMPSMHVEQSTVAVNKARQAPVELGGTQRAYREGPNSHTDAVPSRWPAKAAV